MLIGPALGGGLFGKVQHPTGQDDIHLTAGKVVPDPELGPLGHVLDDELLAKMKAAGMAVNEADKNAFIKASKPTYDEFGKEVPGAGELIDTALALGK